jgi:hypothetical protein
MNTDMNIASVTSALRTFQESEAPDTTPAMKSQLKALKNGALEPLREWLDSISENLSNAEDAAESLPDADREDRDDAHTLLVNDVAGILSDLVTVSTATACDTEDA